MNEFPHESEFSKKFIEYAMMKYTQLNTRIEIVNKREKVIKKIKPKIIENIFHYY